MQRFFKSLLISLWIMSVPAIAQDNLSGIWEGLLVVAPGSEIEVQFSFESDGAGGYTGLLNAPDQPNLTDVSIDAINLQGNTVELQVSDVNGAYQGTIAGETITGTWSQQGQEFELNLAPYQEPVITAENFALVEGSWVGSIRPVPNAEMELTLILDFAADPDGGYAATLSVPDQGARDIPVDSFAIDGNELTVEIAQMRLEIAGDISGEQFDGTFNQAGTELPLQMERGEYESPGLNMTALAYSRLQGPWHGDVGGLTVVIRVEQSGDSFFAYLDSPDQGASDIPLSALSLEGDDLRFTVQAAGVEYAGEMEDGQIVGNWNQGGQGQPLTLVRGPYDVAAGLNAASRQRLLGSWTGVVNDTELQFTFAESEGVFAASLAIPAMGASGLGLSDLSLQGDQLSFTVRGIQASYGGSLSGSQIEGEWTRAGNTNALDLTRGP